MNANLMVAVPKDRVTVWCCPLAFLIVFLLSGCSTTDNAVVESNQDTGTVDTSGDVGNRSEVLDANLPDFMSHTNDANMMVTDLGIDPDAMDTMPMDSGQMSFDATNESDSNVTPIDPDAPVVPLEFSQSMVVGTGVDRTAKMVARDLNGDDQLDLLLANGRHQPELNVYLLNEGDRTFGTAQTYGTPERSYAVQAADMNGDGHVDLVVGNTVPYPCRLFINDGNFNFGDGIAINGGNENIRNLLVADLNADGHDDVIVAQRQGPNWVGLNDGTGTFTRLNFGTGRDATVGLVIRDFNGDGHLDIGAANRSPDQTTIYLGDGSGDYSNAESEAVGAAEDDVRWMDAGDFNGDGVMDVVTIQFRGQDRIYLQTEPMVFTPGPTLGGPNSPSYTVASADMDGNGITDILIGRQGAWNVMYLQQFGGDFSVETRFGTGNDVTYSVEIADMDLDGRMDILVGNTDQENVIYYQD